MSDPLASFRINRNHPLQTHAYYESYMAEEIATGHKFRADFIKRTITTPEQRMVFEECVNNLKNVEYFPIWVPFHDGILTEDGTAVLLWRCKENLISLRDAINNNDNILQNPHCIWLLAFISKGFHILPIANITGGHLNLTIDNVLIDVQSRIPVMIRYGLEKLWLTLYGEQGKIPALICPPEKMNIDQSSINITESFDSYAFGILMYQVLTKQILNENQPFDRTLLITNLVNHSDLFLRELIISATNEDPEKRQKKPFSSFLKIFITILQQQTKPILFRTYCQSCIANGDEKARMFLESSNRGNPPQTPFIYGLPDRIGTYQKPTPVSFIIGKKVIHNVEAFQQKLSQVEPNKRIIFITIFGAYQMGKSTTLYLLSGNNNYVIGNGNEETTRGVSIDGPYQLSRFTEAFGAINNYPNLDQDFSLNVDENLKNEDPYVFLIDVEGFNGDVIGYDDQTNKKLYKDLVKPYLALSTNVLFLCHQNEALITRQFVIENLSIQNFSNFNTGNFFNLSMIIRDVKTYSSLSGEFDYNDPFNPEQINNLESQFLRRFGEDFESHGISVTACPLGDFSTHTAQGVNNHEIPIFDKSFIILARKLISQIYSLSDSLHVTNKVGAIEIFRNLCHFIATREASGADISNAEEVDQIQNVQLQGHRDYILTITNASKSSAIEFITNEINQTNLNDLNPLELDVKRSEWIGKFKNKYNELNNQTNISNVDRFGISQTVLDSACFDVNQLITDTFSRKVSKDAQYNLSLFVTNLRLQSLKKIEQSILEDSTWKYYKDHYDKQNLLVDETIQNIKDEVSNREEFSKIRNQDFQNYKELVFQESKKVLEKEIEETFNKTNSILAQKSGSQDFRKIELTDIPGNDNFYMAEVELVIKGPGKELKQTIKRKVPKNIYKPKPKTGPCILI